MLEYRARCLVVHVSDRVVLGASSYPTEGDAASLVAEVLACTGLADTRLAGTRVSVVNDAVLAAWAFARVSPSPRSRLVLTIGHGVGAALVEATET